MTCIRPVCSAPGWGRRLLCTAVAGLGLLAAPAMASRTATPAVVQTATWGGNTYHLLSEAGWEDSEAVAVGLGGHLVTVDSLAENQFLASTFGATADSLASGGGTVSLWLGLNDRVAEGSYVWSGGQAVLYTNWISGQPQNSMSDEDYAGLMVSDLAAGWHDVVADLRFNDRTFGVVEIAAAPVPEPSMWALCLSGAGLLAWRRRSPR